MAGVGKYKEKEIITAVWNIFSRGTVQQCRYNHPGKEMTLRLWWVRV